MADESTATAGAGKPAESGQAAATSGDVAARSGKPAGEQPAAQAAEAKLTMSEWRERARVTFGVSPHAIAGALSDRPVEPVSEDEVRAALDEWSVVEGS